MKYKIYLYWHKDKKFKCAKFSWLKGVPKHPLFALKWECYDTRLWQTLHEQWRVKYTLKCFFKHITCELLYEMND